MRVVGKAVQLFLPVISKAGSPCEQPLIGVGFQRAKASRRRNRIAGIGIAVEKLDQMFRTAHEGIVNLVRNNHRPHRDDATGQALCRCHHVRLDAEEIRRKGTAKTAKAGDHLIKNQQKSIFVTDFTNAFEIAFWRDQNSGRAGNWFNDHRGNG